ncbi:MAG: N-acetylglucosamine-6-phosphate deacetylase [Chloroflexi bacterium]|nr:N-acetylglucosamine-6-phosphate deacetylase [Chloroflexota bacterium]
MTKLLFHSATIVPPVGSPFGGWLVCDGGRIGACGRGPSPFADTSGFHIIDAGGGYLLPGFIDLHVHGALGHEVMDADVDGLRVMARFFARHGVTAFLPTTWTATRESTVRALQTIQKAAGPVPQGASILGAHLEGPYLNPARCGAQDPQFIRRAAREEAVALLDLNILRLVALAPEFEENHWLIQECARRGVTVSLAHTAATYEQALVAFDSGATQTTHTFNAMTGLAHREPGVVGAALARHDVRCEVIADLVHVHPVPLGILIAQKGPHSTLLITDAVRAAGLPDGSYTIDHRTVTVRDGSVRLPDGTLAGSILTMDRALRNVRDVTGWDVERLWPIASLTPARAIGVSSRKGSIELGKDADLVLLDDSWEVTLTVCAGEVVYQRQG